MVKIQVEVFWLVTPCNFAVGWIPVFQRTLLPLPSEWRWRQQCHPKCWYPTATLHSITSQKILTCTNL